MSYIDPSRSGTTFGVVDFNDIFAPNTTIDWQNILSDMDTIICKIPFTDSASNNLNAYHLLTAYEDAVGKYHWYGPGVYQCVNTSSTAMTMGDAVCMSTRAADAATSSRPVIKIGTTSTDVDFPFGVVLEPIAAQGVGSVAMAGVWPVKRGSNSLAFRQHIVIDNSPTGVVNDTSSGTKGAMGKLIKQSYDIIVDGGDVENGAIILMWGTSKEIF